MLKLQECKGHYKASDIVQPTRLSKHEKGLILPKKKATKGKKEVTSKAGRKGRKPGKKAGFLLKIKDVDKDVSDDNTESRPD